jgi:hypothetical protein
MQGIENQYHLGSKEVLLLANCDIWTKFRRSFPNIFCKISCCSPLAKPDRKQTRLYMSEAAACGHRYWPAGVAAGLLRQMSGTRRPHLALRSPCCHHRLPCAQHGSHNI